LHHSGPRGGRQPFVEPYIKKEIVPEALAPVRDQIVVATNSATSADRAEPAPTAAEHIRNVAETALKRLKTDRIDLYQHRVDRSVPVVPLARFRPRSPT